MHKGSAIPLVEENASLSDALVEMTTKGLGMTGITDSNGKLVGIYTDGDLRRTLAKQSNVDCAISEIMTHNPVTAKPNMLAAELVTVMKTQKIGALLVTHGDNVVGALNMQDLLKAGVL